MSLAASRGPLSSALSQWAVIALGGLGLYGNENVCNSLLNGIQKLLVGTAIASNSYHSISRGSISPQSPQSIVIHGGMGSSSSLIHHVVQWTIGAILIWGSFSMLQNILPEKVKELLPVTRQVFDTAVTSLGNGIVNIRDVLSRQILGLEEKQDEFGYKLDETHTEVVRIRDDVIEMNEVLLRCEESLKRGDEKQTFTAKGLRLLLKCVGSMLPANSKFHPEIDSLYNTSHVLDVDGIQSPPSKDNTTYPSCSSPSNRVMDSMPNTPMSSRLSSADTYTTFDTSFASSPRVDISNSKHKKYPISNILGDLEYSGNLPTEYVDEMVQVMKKIGVTIRQ